MIETNMNMFDTAVIAIMGISVLVSLFRGFIKEFLSLFAWFAAAIVAIYCFEDVTQLLKPYIKSDMIAAGVAGLGTYLTVLIGLSILNGIIVHYVKSGAEVGFLDKMLGIGFGAARGAFIVSLGFILMSLFWSEDSEPEWVKTAKTRTYVERGAQMLTELAPEYLERIKKSTQDAADSAEDTADTNAPAPDFDAYKNEARDTIKDTVDDAKDAAKDASEDIKDGVNDAVKDGAKTIRNSIDDLNKKQQ